MLSSNKLNLIEEILKPNDSFKNFDFKNFESEIHTISIKTSITIYLISRIISGNINIENQIKDILHNFITPYFVQYFYLETQRLKFFLNHARIEIEMQKDAMKIFKNSLGIIQEKSLLFKLIILLESKANVFTTAFIRTSVYKFINFLMIVVIKIKR